MIVLVDAAETAVIELLAAADQPNDEGPASRAELASVIVAAVREADRKPGA